MLDDIHGDVSSLLDDDSALYRRSNLEHDYTAQVSCLATGSRSNQEIALDDVSLAVNKTNPWSVL